MGKSSDTGRHRWFNETYLLSDVLANLHRDRCRYRHTGSYPGVRDFLDIPIIEEVICQNGGGRAEPQPFLHHYYTYEITYTYTDGIYEGGGFVSLG